MGVSPVSMVDTGLTVGAGRLQSLAHKEEDEVGDAVGVAPFVVVPGDDFAGLADHLGEF